MTEPCGWAGCEKSARTRLGDRSLCLDHFLEQARGRIESLFKLLDGTTERNLSPEVQSFLSEVISETTVLAAETRMLAPSQREELIALSTRAAEVYKCIQRTPRYSRRVACLVRPDSLSSDPGEKSYTVNISQRGACIDLRQNLKVGQTVIVARVDVQRSARARVAWLKPSVADRLLVGLEIIDEPDFWGLGMAAEASNQ
jgi:PilZ domain